ncbi:MAG TPA: HEAT repeat domain-containing protein [Isosphaeraceae bacterium]|jgi:HEAT repeat protein|nr:HEAT repeat domain-containing protein [Isosphaeraceae bacterium]
MRLPRIRVRELMLLVACCAFVCWEAIVLRDSDPIAGATRRLRSGDVEVRRAAASELGVRLSDALPAIPALVAATRDPDAEVRRAAAESIGVVTAQGPAGGPGEAAAVRALMAVLEDPDPRLRVAASTALRRIASPIAAPALAAALRDRNPSVRGIAASALGGMGQASRDQAPALLAAIAAESDPRDREGLLITLPRLDPDPAVALPPLTSRLARDGDERARAATARALGDVLDARLRAGEVPPATHPALAALRAAISDRSPLVRLQAVASLGRIRASAPDPLAPVLDEALLRALSHRRADVRAAAASLYSRNWITHVDVMPISDEIVRALVKGLRDPEADVRHHAAWALMQTARARHPLGSKHHDAFVRVLPDLRAALRDSDLTVRDAAFHALTALGRGAPEGDRDFRAAARFAAKEFVALLRDPREDVRQIAATSLISIDPRDADLVLDALSSAAEHDRTEVVRNSAAFAVQRIKEVRASK